MLSVNIANKGILMTEGSAPAASSFLVGPVLSRRPSGGAMMGKLPGARRDLQALPTA